MLTPANPYYQQVALLLDVLPLVAEEPCFALKGGTAINLFVRDLPRLSVDIDLTYLPVQDRTTSFREVGAALERLATSIQKKWPGRIERMTNEGHVFKLIVRRHHSQIKIEVSPVLRGCVREPSIRGVCSMVEEQFGYVEVPVVHSHDLYSGKLCAALDRQHPRDLFDVKQLLEHEGLDDNLLEVFLVYLLSSNRSLTELLSPNLQPLARTFEEQFRGMALIPVTVEELEHTRKKMITLIHERLTERQRTFLLSFKRGEPDWSLLPFDGIERLPAVQWKLLNIQRMAPFKREQAVERLRQVLTK
ncbi:MAG: hypothetical protein NPIRA05_04700 [Nitrospirales bacterium]|nr:MAG: hypothetical protein NPIRA05_04700 [Nitrospirales bacterium]